MTVETLVTGVILILLVAAIIWASAKFPILPPPPPPEAPFDTHINYWRELAVIQGIHPGTSTPKVVEWAKRIPDRTVRDQIVTLLRFTGGQPCPVITHLPPTATRTKKDDKPPSTSKPNKPATS